MHHPPDVTPHTTRRGRGVIAVLASAIAALVAVGLGLTVTLVSHAQAVAAATPAAPGVPQHTKFGLVQLSDVQRVAPMDMDDMPTVNGQMISMGMGDDIPAGSIALVCTVTLTNTKDHAVKISPNSFRLLRATPKGAKVVEPKKTTLAAAQQLRPNSSLDAEVSFIVPEDGAPLRVTFTDIGSHTPVLFDAGRTDSAPSDSAHHHH